MTRREVVDYLHKNLGYSRRLSAKLADIVFLSKSSRPFEFALKEALEKVSRRKEDVNRTG